MSVVRMSEEQFAAHQRMASKGRIIKVLKDETPDTKRPRATNEHELQVAYTTWRRSESTLSKYPELRWAYAVPNGGQRSKAVAGKLKAEGVEAGIYDYCLPIRRGACPGMYIEFMAKYNQPSDLQVQFMLFVRSQGYRTVVCWNLDDAIDATTAYLESI